MKKAIAILTCIAALHAPTATGIDASNDAAHQVRVQHTMPRDASDVRAYVQARASRSGWKGAQWRCLDAILTAESHYRLNAQNGVHVGIFQHATTPPGSTAATQWRLGAKYIKHRYGTPCNALHFRLQKGWF